MLNKLLFLAFYSFVIYEISCQGNIGGKYDLGEGRHGVSNLEHFVGCEVGWYRYKQYKCVLPSDIQSTYAEAYDYCKTAYGATLLNITSEEERVFWSYQLMRKMGLGANAWLETPFEKEDMIFKSKDKSCNAMKSKPSNDNHQIGAVIQQSCQTLGTTVCEIVANKKVVSHEPVKDFNENLDFLPNVRMNLANGTKSQFYTGVYYEITSKFNNTPLSNGVLGSSKCSLAMLKGNNCANELVDTEVDGKWANYYTFTSDQAPYFQIRKLNSDKLLVFENQKFLVNFKTFEDGLTKMGKEATKDSLKGNGADDLWKIETYGKEGSYVISSRTNGYVLGAVEYLNGKNKSVAFGLYDRADLNLKDNEKLLFNIDHLGYTLDVEVMAIEFDKSLEAIVASNKKQISIIDTAIINNNSPATLTHDVSSNKELVESFKATFGASQEFMEKFTHMDEVDATSTDTRTVKKSFTDAVAEAISSSMTQKVTRDHDDSDSKHKASNIDAEINANYDNNNPNNSIKADGSFKYHKERQHDIQNHNSDHYDRSDSESDSSKKDHSDTTGHDNTKTNSTTNKNTNEKTNEGKKETDQSITESGTQKRTYSIHKSVNLPPYTAVKISSYANWINDIQIQFKMNLKFRARSFRRSLTGDGRNEWRTMDSQFVEHLMGEHNFKGEVLKTTYDSVYGQISGFLRASVGLESVFTAKEVELNSDE